jgi:hypothetical protein
MPDTAPWKLAPGKTSLTVVIDKQLGTPPSTDWLTVQVGLGLRAICGVW